MPGDQPIRQARRGGGKTGRETASAVRRGGPDQIWGTFVNIRQATIADLDALVPLFDAYRQFYKAASDTDAARRFLADRFHRQESIVFLAEANGEALGFTQIYPSFSSHGMARTFILNDLFVAPGARGLGLGKALLKTARDYAYANGAARLSLSTTPDNVAAQTLYEKQGWERGFLTYTIAAKA
jgi:GNAT superfamily N-acetyltransferase